MRKKLDLYETPPWVVKAILPYLKARPGDSVLEPACGGGNIVRCLTQQGWRRDEITTIDIDPQHQPDTCADFLATSLYSYYDLCITNPPFSIALDFVRNALFCAEEVAMLLRLNFLASQKRAPFWRANPADVFVIPKRPSFRPEGGTDSHDYGWFVWGRGRGNRWQILEV